MAAQLPPALLKASPAQALLPCKEAAPVKRQPAQAGSRQAHKPVVIWKKAKGSGTSFACPKPCHHQQGSQKAQAHPGPAIYQRKTPKQKKAQAPGL